MADALDILLPGRPLLAEWTRQRWEGDDRSHLGRRWDAVDPVQPSYTQRRCAAEVRVCDNGSAEYRLDAEDGPRQYFAWSNGHAGTVDDTIALATAAAEAWMAEPVAYPRLLRCPQSGRACSDGPCASPWSGCEGVAAGEVPRG